MANSGEIVGLKGRGAVVRAFLAGRPLPVPAWTTDGVPAGYQGPP